MNANKKTRLALDAMLTILIIAAMFVQYTGVSLHEIIGFTFFALVVIHLVLSARWIKNTVSSIGRRKATRRKIVLLVIGAVLCIAMVVLATSSIAISTILSSFGFTFFAGQYNMWSYLHSVSSYVLCAIVVIHLATHWAFIASAFKSSYVFKNRRVIGAGVYASALAGASVLSSCAFMTTVPNAQTTETIESVVVRTFENGSTTPESTTGEKRISSNRKNSSVQYSKDSSSQDGENWYASSDEEQDNTGFGGFCTLCHKGCSLSAPQCNRPYAEGLIDTSQSR